MENNSFCLQGPSTTACGDYCVLFCLLISRGWSEQKIINSLAILPGFEARDHAVCGTLVSAYGTEIYHTLQETRPGLMGAHRLHVKPAVRLLLQ